MQPGPVANWWIRDKPICHAVPPKPITGGTCPKYYFCHCATKVLSRQTKTCACRDKTCVCCAQAKFCHNKHFVTTKWCFLQQIFVTTKLLSWSAYFCREKRCVLSRQTRVCCDKHVSVVTKLLPRQKWCLWQPLPMIMIKTSLSITPATFSSRQSSASSTVTLIQDGHQRKLNLPTIWRNKFPLPNLIIKDTHIL